MTPPATGTSDGTYTRCNSRRKGQGHVPKIDPGPPGGEPYCGRPAGWGTDHVGHGRCKLHGGNMPIKHGRRSRRVRTQLGDRIEELANDPDLMDLSGELATARALLERALERLEEGQETDLEAITRITAEVTRIAKRIEDIRAQNALSMKELSRIMAEMGRTVALRVEDPATLEAIREDWSSIRL